MFISRNLVYLELQKTGSTHIRRILKDLIGGRIIGKHNQIESKQFISGRSILGSIRDPWEWYISLWAFGCDKKGALYKNLTRQRLNVRGLGWKSYPLAALFGLLSRIAINPERWEKTYNDVNDPDSFRAWINMIHDPKNFYFLGEGYGASRMRHFAGFLTFRYLKLYCTKVDEVKNLITLPNLDHLENYEQDHCFVDLFVRNERLEHDLFNSLDICGIKITENKKAELISWPKINSSSRKYGPIYYYDIATERLIAEREKLIVEKFGYVPPSLRDYSQNNF
jgi:hypothetical protein